MTEKPTATLLAAERLLLALSYQTVGQPSAPSGRSIYPFIM